MVDQTGEHTHKHENEDESEGEDLEDLDEDQITHIFKHEGIMKKDSLDIEEQPLFVGIECQMSFYIFSKDNCFRRMCYLAINYKLWERMVMILIFLSSFKLAYDTYYMDLPPKSEAA